MAKKYNACYVVLGKEHVKKFVCIESGSNDPSTLTRIIEKRHPKNDIVIKYIRPASTATNEQL
jgi:hypothetical protein